MTETKPLPVHSLNETEIKNYLESCQIILNSIKKPSVSDIESHSVLVRLSPFEVKTIIPSTCLSEGKALETNHSQSSVLLADWSGESINYTLELANESNIFNQVYTGDANEITLKDLKPFTKYFLR